MEKQKIMGSVLAGIAAGAVTGLFGTGGGMVLVPLLTAWTSLEPKQVFSSSVAIILPICLVTLAASAWKSSLPWQDALPYLIGSGAGGYIAGKWGQLVPVKWLHRSLGLLILWGGFRYLC